MKTVLQKLKKQKLAIAVSSVLVMSASSALLADEESKIQINIKAEQADKVLFKLAELSGTQIVFDNQTQKNVKLPALNGDFTLDSALTELLKNTGLTYEFISEDMVMIRTESHAEPEAKKEVEEIVITGSRLKGVAATGSPVLTITSDDIKRQGFGSIEDIMRSLTQNFSDVNAASTLDEGISSPGAQGHSAPNLRGLGSASTLVLVNGRRWPQSSYFQNGTVNLNGIPFNAIDRVDILSDGASAIYGSDAQAGVINIILRKDYSGGETGIRYETSRYDAKKLTLDQTLGFNWEGGNATLNIAYTETDPVDSRAAGRTTLDFRSMGGSDRRATDVGRPGLVYNSASRFATLLGSLPQGDDGTGGINGNLSPANVLPYDYVAEGEGGDGTSTQEQKSAYFTINQELFDGFSLFAEYSYNRNETLSQLTTSTIKFTKQAVPTTNPYNDTGSTVYASYAFSPEEVAQLGDGRFNSDQTAVSYTLGFDAELPFKDWTMNFSMGKSDEKSQFKVLQIDKDLLLERLAGVDGDSNPLPIEQIINPFGDGSAQSPEALQGLLAYDATGAVPSSVTLSDLRDYSVSFQGGLFELPTGEVRTVVGAEYRKEGLDHSKGYARSGLLVDKTDRDVKSYFTELSVPLIREMPGVHSLDLKYALRRDEYTVSGPFEGSGTSVEKEFSSTSPKLELAWYPIDTLKLRAAKGESFRAPTLTDLFGRQDIFAFGIFSFIDPNRPDLGLQRPPTVLGGNPDLKPELSDNVSYGFDWNPDGALEGLSVSVTKANIEISDLIADGLQAFFSDRNGVLALPGVLSYNPDGSASQLNLYSVNVSKRYSESVDTRVSYDFDSDYGSFRVGLNATYTGKLNDQFTPNSAQVKKDNTDVGIDRWKARGEISWFKDDINLNLVANYSSSYSPTGVADTYQDLVEHYITYDLTGSYAVEESGWKFNGGVLNVLNQDFPFYDGLSYPWDTRRVDTRGRTIFLEVNKSYDLY
ncbi:TonB-dependent receptor [Porticoccaceae bacterium LTM1]|nr:TonB-dependent receptor [Porticoccaceae bacterium LTM1]